MAGDPNAKPPRHAFCSHAWGKHNTIHDLVARVYNALLRLGIIGWFDAKDMNGNIRDEMLAGIHESMGFLAFITKAYHDKVTGDNDLDNCHFEFDFAMNHKGKSKMLTVVMEKEMLDTSKWKLPLMTLSKKLYVDMTEIDGMLDDELDTLVKTKLVPKMTWLPEDVRKTALASTAGG